MIMINDHFSKSKWVTRSDEDTRCYICRKFGRPKGMEKAYCSYTKALSTSAGGPGTLQKASGMQVPNTAAAIQTNLASARK
jgi:hypothetical protein